jgi:hypothetical protein
MHGIDEISCRLVLGADAMSPAQRQDSTHKPQHDLA